MRGTSFFALPFVRSSGTSRPLSSWNGITQKSPSTSESPIGMILRCSGPVFAHNLVLRESWGLVLAEKLEFCIMEAIEFKFEERLVTKAVGLPQEGFDLVVDAFHPAVVDAVLPPVQDSTSMEGESFGQLLHLTNVRVDRPLAPF